MTLSYIQCQLKCISIHMYYRYNECNIRFYSHIWLSSDAHVVSCPGSVAQVGTSRLTFSIPIVYVVNHSTPTLNSVIDPFWVFCSSIWGGSNWLRFDSRLASTFFVVVGKTLLMYRLFFLCGSMHGKLKFFVCIYYMALVHRRIQKMVVNFWNWLIFKYFCKTWTSPLNRYVMLCHILRSMNL